MFQDDFFLLVPHHRTYINNGLTISLFPRKPGHRTIGLLWGSWCGPLSMYNLCPKLRKMKKIFRRMSECSNIKKKGKKKLNLLLLVKEQNKPHRGNTYLYCLPLKIKMTRLSSQWHVRHILPCHKLHMCCMLTELSPFPARFILDPQR